jgi:hypothetical protein
MLNHAEHRYWTWDLVKAAVEDNPNNILLARFIEKYPEYNPANPPPPQPDYIETFFVNGGYLFIGRKELRQKLRELKRMDDSSRIFLVVGEARSGKSHTSELISYLATKSQGHNYIPIDLQAYSYQPFNIVEEIAKKIGASPEEIATIPVQDEKDPRNIISLGTWLQNKIVRTENKIWWFVFDNFQSGGLLPETIKMIVKLALIIEKEIRDKCYLVILDYKNFSSKDYTNILPTDYTNFLSMLDSNAAREEIKLLGEEDLIDFFDKWFKDNGKVYENKDIKKAVDEITRQTEEEMIKDSKGDLEELKSLQKRRLEYLTTSVNKAIKRYKENGFVL